MGETACDPEIDENVERPDEEELSELLDAELEMRMQGTIDYVRDALLEQLIEENDRRFLEAAEEAEEGADDLPPPRTAEEAMRRHRREYGDGGG